MSTATFVTFNKTTHNHFKLANIVELLLQKYYNLKKVCFMTIYFGKVIIGILDYLQKYSKIKWLKRIILQLICLYMSFSPYFVVKFISLVMTFKVF